MAFLGSVGKALGISTPEAANIAASFAAGGPIAGFTAAVGSLGEGSDVTPRTTVFQPPRTTGPIMGPETSPSTPAGVDSPASLTQLSQTSMIPQQAFVGGFGLAAPALGAARTLGKTLFGSPGAAFTTGSVATAAVDFFVDQFGQQKKLVITRKMKRDVNKLFMMSGGDFNMTAELYRMATGRQITGEMVVKIITKTFKNQGPYVTKAAVRKTRSTIRKMETLCDLKDRLCPPKRAAPRRRATTATKILQVK